MTTSVAKVSGMLMCGCFVQSALMNRKGTRSMSFSHETSEALVNETRCYGAAIGVSDISLLSTSLVMFRATLCL